MELLKSLGRFFGFRPSISQYAFNPLQAQRDALKAIEAYTIYPETNGNTASRLYRKMLREDAHLRGLHRRLELALLAARVRINCDDKAVEQVVHDQLGFNPQKPSFRFQQFNRELVSSLQYGYSVHQKTFDNDSESGQTVVNLRRIEPVDVYEFTVNNGKLVSVAEAFNEAIHGVKNKAKTRRTKDNLVEVVDIPADEIIHVAPMQLGRNFWGESAMLAAIPDWVLKRMYRYAEALYQGRFSVPLPVGKTNTNNENNANVIAGIFDMPATDPSRLLVIDQDSDIELKSPQGRSTIDVSIKYCDFSMSKLYLEQYIDLGDKTYGSRALSEDQSQDFHSSLNFYEASVIWAIEVLANEIARNNFPNPPPVEVVFDDLEFRGRRAVLQMYAELVEKGVIEPTDDISKFILEELNLPTTGSPIAPPEPRNDE